MMKMGMRSVALFYILIKIFARATPAEQGPRLMVSFSWEQIADERFLQILRSFERIPAFEHGIKAALSATLPGPDHLGQG